MQVKVDRKNLRSAFSDLVIHDQLLDQLGPAPDFRKTPSSFTGPPEMEKPVWRSARCACTWTPS
jgi:hypothetical protein